MSTENLRSDDAVWGSPDPEPRPWGVRETLMAAGIAAVIAALGGAAIYAATGHSSPQFTAPPGHHAEGPPATA
ncbi:MULTISPECIES: hypothetical protein [Mycolicibacterium]|jgi:hypothetical protein|uniref:Uncharacterized protein n=1 Tax=Mycolicibacterium austroafricanum TaxID=39687 RepID=A0ABT8HL61_MYCAO|nr:MULTISPECIES: hypothetical protein [Mycolicibacterium]MCV7127085.1 hypothetical protein [Mycolicibacterium vanbaalenii PYR-1]MDN4521498.1 hypothetical protein [Mycolicibacterium austroafricanum]MDW5610622.1 hypothetical protein [Mycolicibacterium sp. D5.8-2]PQP44964.1 hypothetical protein C6A88_21100 [Mycolicibacterium austroafricanum]QRZ10188.1 hypothetical protein JN090_21450 [Mycolicibacterium austroafricanum]